VTRWFLLLGLLVSLAASSGTLRAQKAVTLKWWDFPRPWADAAGDKDVNAWNAKLVKQYMDANPGVTIEFTPVSWVDGPRKLDVAVAAGEAPDVMYGFPALFGRMLSLQVLAPVDSKLNTMDKADLADYFPAAMDFVLADGKHWAFPWYYNAEGEWAVNLTVAKEAGALDLVPKGPEFSWTPDQVLALAKKCTFKRANGEEVWGIAFATNQGTGVDIWPTWSFARMFGADLYDPSTGKSSFAGDAGVKAFQYMLDLVKTHKVAPPASEGVTNNDRDDLWHRKQVCIMISSGVELANGVEAGLKAGSIQAPFEVQAVLPPAADGVKVRVAGGVGVQMVFDNKDADRLQAALDFAAWLTNSDNLLVFKNLSPLTARQSATEKLGKDDPHTAWRLKYVLTALAPYSKHPQDLAVDDAWMQAVQSLLAGQRSPKEAAQWFQDEANRLLSEKPK
jgi:multiple sugar transport system substrate-binding protein